MKPKKLILPVIILILIALAGGWFMFSSKGQTNKLIKAPEVKKEVVPSDTSIDYTDPAGFSFSYPDNLSIENNASEDSADLINPNAYADLQLFSKDISGSINIKIVDTKFKSLDEWLKENNISESNIPVDKKLGNLEAIEVKTSDRVMLASLDQGVLFTVDMPLIEQGFWSKVYDKVLAGFTFAAPETASAGVSNSSVASTDEVVFEGEEVVE